MKIIRTIRIGVIGMTLFTSTVYAQTIDFDLVKYEVNQAVTKEQNAFKKGDCDTVLSLMDDNITFLANGRRAPSKEMIGRFCNAANRPFKTPLFDTIDIYPLRNDTAYTIRKLEFLKDETTKVEEFVTKIWKKTDGNWKIVHLHATVKELNSN